MQSAGGKRPDRRVLVRLLVIVGVFGAVVALLLRFKSTSDASEFPLPARFADFVTLTLSVLVEALPFVILGALVSVFIRLFAPTERLLGRLPRTPLLRRLCISLFGAFMPVCECGNVLVARGLIVRGLTVAESTTFLLAAPIINPVTFLSTASAFSLDPSVVWTRMAGALFIANLVGGLISLHKDQMDLVSKGFYNDLCETEAAGGHDDHHGHDHHGSGGGAWREGVEIFRDETSLMLKVLCLGAVIAGLTQVFVPRDVLTALGSDPVFSILAMIALAFVVSICANVDAFFALAYASTFTAGSIVAFLVFGPMVDIKMLALMRTTYKTRLLALITLLVALCSVLIGLLVNYAL